MNRLEIGNRIKDFLKSNGITQARLADMTGYKQSVLSEMMSGKRNVIPLAEKVAELLNADLTYLLTGNITSTECDNITNGSDNITNNGLTKEDCLRLIDKIEHLYEMHQQRIQEANDIMKQVLSITKLLTANIASTGK